MCGNNARCPNVSLQWRHNEHDGVSNTCLTIVYSTAYSCADQRKQPSSASLAFVRGIIPITRVSNAENISIWWRHHVRSWSFDCPPPFECYTMGPKASLISVLNVANFMEIGWHQQVGIVCVHVVIYLWFYRLIKETFQPCTAPPAYTRVLFSSDVYDREHAEQLTWNRAWSFTHAYWDIFIEINNSSA